MRIKSILVVAIIAMAMLIGTASAGNVVNTNPVFGTYYTGSYEPGTFTASGGIVAVSIPDEFVLNDLGECGVQFYSVAGDWNGYDDISEFSFEIEDEIGNIVFSGDMSALMPGLNRPFQIGEAYETFTVAGTYTITCYIEDQYGLYATNQLTFTIYSSPEFIVSDININGLTPGENNCYSFTIENVRGEPTMIMGVDYTDIVDDDIFIDGDLISDDIPETGYMLMPGQTMTVNFCINLTDEFVMSGEFDDPIVTFDATATGSWIIQTLPMPV